MKRKNSKVTNPNDGANKPKLKAFRTTNEVSGLLDGLENASDFIQTALLTAFSQFTQVTCPTCKGKGKIGHIKASKKKLKNVS